MAGGEGGIDKFLYILIKGMAINIVLLSIYYFFFYEFRPFVIILYASGVKFQYIAKNVVALQNPICFISASNYHSHYFKMKVLSTKK